MGNWGFFTPISGVITLLITGRGPPCSSHLVRAKVLETLFLPLQCHLCHHCSGWCFQGHVQQCGAICGEPGDECGSERYSSKNTRVDTQNDGLENVQDLVSKKSMLGIYVQLQGGRNRFPGKPLGVATLTACFPYCQMHGSLVICHLQWCVIYKIIRAC